MKMLDWPDLAMRYPVNKDLFLQIRGGELCFYTRPRVFIEILIIMFLGGVMWFAHLKKEAQTKK